MADGALWRCSNFENLIADQDLIPWSGAGGCRDADGLPAPPRRSGCDRRSASAGVTLQIGCVPRCKASHTWLQHQLSDSSATAQRQQFRRAGEDPAETQRLPGLVRTGPGSGSQGLGHSHAPTSAAVAGAAPPFPPLPCSGAGWPGAVTGYRSSLSARQSRRSVDPPWQGVPSCDSFSDRHQLSEVVWLSWTAPIVNL